MNRCRAAIIWAVPVLVSLVAPSTQAAADIESQERAAKKACLIGDVEKGVEILAELYLNSNNPTYLYNQGRCYEQNGRNGSAVLRFKEYLRKAKGLPAADTEAVRKKIDELEATPAQPTQGGAPTTAAPPAPLPLAPAPVLAPTAQPAVELSQPAPSPQASESEPVYKRWWFWTGIGVVVAGGVVTALLLGQKSAPKSPACSNQPGCVP